MKVFLQVGREPYTRQRLAVSVCRWLAHVLSIRYVVNHVKSPRQSPSPWQCLAPPTTPSNARDLRVSCQCRLSLPGGVHVNACTIPATVGRCTVCTVRRVALAILRSVEVDQRLYAHVGFLGSLVNASPDRARCPRMGARVWGVRWLPKCRKVCVRNPVDVCRCTEEEYPEEYPFGL